MNISYRIPFCKPELTGNELTYIGRAAASGHFAGDGSFTERCHDLLETALGVPRILLTTSCTHALEIAGLLLRLQPGDEVILPSFTFASTANAFLLRGARPVFADIRPDTLNLDETGLERLISPRTRAIVPVHYAGVSCEMDAILDIAGAHGIPVVEDNAHGLFGRYRGRFLGTMGCLGAQSFHETKNITCGEGGALVINDAKFCERAEMVREKGTNRSRLIRGEISRYTWVELGSSYLLSDLLAAFLYAQLEARESIRSRRRRIWLRYREGLQQWAERRGFDLPFVPAHCEQSYHLFYLLLPDLETRQALIAHLAARGIASRFHYLPLHLSEMGRGFGGYAGQCPVSERVSECLLRLPLYNTLSTEDQDRVIAAVLEFGGSMSVKQPECAAPGIPRCLSGT